MYSFLVIFLLFTTVASGMPTQHQAKDTALKAKKKSGKKRKYPKAETKQTLDISDKIQPSRCPICLESATPLRKENEVTQGGVLMGQLCNCTEKYHIGCLLRVSKCPTCRCPYTPEARLSIIRIHTLYRKSLEPKSLEEKFLSEIRNPKSDTEPMPSFKKRRQSLSTKLKSPKTWQKRQTAQELGESMQKLIDDMLRTLSAQ